MALPINPRQQSLDGLRGFAALAVIFYHSILMFVPSGEKVNHLLGNTIFSLSGYESYARFVLALVSGETAVMIFFVISGYVLMRSLNKDEQTHSGYSVFWFFVLKRTFRIYPALIGCLISMFIIYNGLNILFPHIYPQFEIKDFLTNMTLYEIKVHGATWTLKAEMLAIPFILLAFVLRKYIGIFGVILLGAYSAILFEFPAFGFDYYLISSWLIYFVTGFLVYDLSNTSFVRDLISGKKWILILLGVIFFRPLFSISSLVTKFIQLFCIMILVSSFAGTNLNPLNSFFSKKIPVFFGKISYSLYLWNVIFLNVFLHPVSRIEWFKNNYIESGILVGILITVISIPFSIFSERWLERPFMNFWSAHQKARRMVVTSAEPSNI
ncbi:acyltransferase family protein [Bilophila wadsworthia]|uniref:acyltransferase family protein n=1 Tax=Bilophila wadsworthia TaxID=35833 RepID=UPI0032C01DDF